MDRLMGRAYGFPWIESVAATAFTKRDLHCGVRLAPLTTGRGSSNNAFAQDGAELPARIDAFHFPGFLGFDIFSDARWGPKRYNLRLEWGGTVSTSGSPGE